MKPERVLVERRNSSPILPSAATLWSRRYNRLILAGLLIVLSLAGVFYGRATGTLIEIYDEAGYLYGGMRIAEVGRPTYENQYNVSIGPYFTLTALKVQRPGDDERFYPNYPPGYPLLIALVRLMFPGWQNGIFYVTPLLALLAALAVYGLGRRLGRGEAGLWAALLLLLTPVTIYNGTHAFSDVPALACLLMGYALLLTNERPSALRGMAAGVFFGYAWLIRQISVVELIGVAVWLWLNRAEWRHPRRAWLGMGVTLALLGAAVLVYNTRVFGGPFTTGYAPQHHWIPFPAFSWQNFLGQSPIRPGGYQAVLTTVWGNLGVLGLAGAAVGLCVTPRRPVITLGITALAFSIVQAFYAWPASDTYGRFLLPTLAILRLFVALGMAWLLGRLRARREIVLVLGTVLILLAQGPQALDTFRVVAQRTADTAARVAYVRDVAVRTPPTAIFISRRYGDHFILYGNRAALLLEMLVTREPGRYREEEFEPTLTRAVQALLDQGAPVYVVADGVSGTRAGFFDPLPVLKAHFRLELCPNLTPSIYRIVPVAPSIQLDDGC